MSKVFWPAWYYGPDGEADIFENGNDVPSGWQDKPFRSSEGDGLDLDAEGHPYTPEIHSAIKKKNKDGLWKMKVGIKRPDPVNLDL